MSVFCLLDCVVFSEKCYNPYLCSSVYNIFSLFFFIISLVLNSNIPYIVYSNVNCSHPQYLLTTKSLYLFTTFIQFSHLPSQFKHFDYDVSWNNYLHVSSAWGSLNFLDHKEIKTSDHCGLLVFHIVEYYATN